VNDRVHKPVLLAEVLALVPAAAKVVVDCTVGGGGHAEALLDRIDSEGELIGFDRDVDALETARARLARFGGRSTLIHDSYVNLNRRLSDSRVGKVDFALMDLGLSSLQLEATGRGFAFQQSSDPLDLRFDRTSGEPLSVKLAYTSAVELRQILRANGEVDNAGRIANDIVTAVKNDQLQTVAHLRDIVSEHFRGGKRNQLLAQVWQALRIWVNDELRQVETGLVEVLGSLRPGGVMAVISFHSLEDRLAKEFFRDQENPCTCPRELPRCVCGKKPALERITRKAIKAGAIEIEENPRARSARLRAARKLAVT
jgi:16S rRNA (cytosine1402-N4)-methyltransferase